MSEDILLDQSAVRAHWLFDEAPPGRQKFLCKSFPDYSLEGRILFSAGSESPGVLAIHGANSDYTKLNPLLYPLQQKGVATLSFNLSGHSVASGVALHGTSLGNNLKEALKFFHVTQPGTRAVIGHSLGGALALKLAEAHCDIVDRIVLFCPAIYPDSAYSKAFGPQFKAALSQPHGFLDSSSYRFLREFRGTVMLVMGEYDGLRATDFGGRDGTSAGEVVLNGMRVHSPIPAEVIEAIARNVPTDRLITRILPGCDHRVAGWLRMHPEQAGHLAGKVADFLNAPR